MGKEFQTSKSNINYLTDNQLLNIIGSIYNTENYCLKRFPRLVNLVESYNLSKVLSDHVSVIMDRLNLLDDVFTYYHVKPSSLKNVSTSIGDNIKGLLNKNDIKNHLLLTNLIEVIKYRFTIYELLVSATNDITQINIHKMLEQFLVQEEKLYQDLNYIRKQYNNIDDNFHKPVAIIRDKIVLE